MTTLKIEALTPEAFAPYGRPIGKPDRTEDAAGPGWRWWAGVDDLETDGRGWTIGYLDLEPAEKSFDWAERHMRTREAIIATSDDVLVYVGPPEVPEEPDRLPPLETFRIFRVPAGTGVVLHPAVWHGAPLATSGRSSAFVLLLEGTGTDDVTVVRFPDSPVQVEGDVSA